MKIAFFSIAVLIALAIVGAGGFLLGYQQFERSLLASTRSPQKLEQEIIRLEMEKQMLQQQVSDLQAQVEAGVENQAQASEAIAKLETTLAEMERSLEKKRDPQP